MTLKLKRFLLLVGDLLVLYVSLYLSLCIGYDFRPSVEILLAHFLPFTLLFGVWIVVFFILGLYSIRQIQSDLAFFAAFLLGMVANGFLSVLFFYLVPFASITPKTNLVIIIILSSALLTLWRHLINRAISSSALQSNALIMGETPDIRALVSILDTQPQFGLNIVQTISQADLIKQGDINLRELILKHDVRVIIVNSNWFRNKLMVKHLFEALPLRIKIYNYTDLMEQITGKIPVHIIEQEWFLEKLSLGTQNIYEGFKRSADVIGSSLLLLASLGLLPLIALGIKLNSRGPVFFVQTRTGYLGNPFRLIKFRTMVSDAEKAGPQWASPHDPRITGFGRFLRKTRVDELPQLINVLRGEMSFIGPRPEQPEFVSALTKIIPFYYERHLVKPGLSGWAQIHLSYGGSESENYEKLQYDLFYIKNRSFVLDTAIALTTIKTILTARGR